ncbi:ATP-binding cassette domain-containing protein [Peptoniphilus vaginalis]|uniref:ATP-binding cassette domain-containing protein n=1 Tax=Peptoniphilus vaginalis TaxID=1756987 RepID=UPI000A269D69|nr:ABC transporter ATP-binding protein [Peptoniphilus vaginalis]
MKITGLIQLEIRKFIFLVIIYIFYPAMDILAALQLATSVDMLIVGNVFSFINYLIIAMFFWSISIFCRNYANIKEQILLQLLSKNLRNISIGRVCDDLNNNEGNVDFSKYINMMTNDILLIEKSLDSLLKLFSILSTIIFVTLALIKFHYIIFIVATILGVVMIKIPKLFESSIKITTDEVSFANESLQRNITVWIKGSKVLKHFRAQDMLYNISEKYSDLIKKAKVEQTKCITRSNFIVSIMNIFSQITILVITGILSYQGQVSLGAIISVVSLSGQLFNSLDEFGESYVEAISSNFLLKKYSLTEKTNPRGKIILKESIKLENLSYNYGNEKIQYPDITFKAGGKYIISGKSGVGKTTLLNIIFGSLENYKGCIFWDNIEYKDLTLDKGISYISQDPYMFLGTIRDNIILDKEYDVNLFDEIIKISRLHTVIESLPHRENTEVDSDNIIFSKGEIQRIAIARALYHKETVLIIDEGLSNIDKYNAKYIEEYLFGNQELTVLMITHNLSKETEKVVSKIIELK